MGENKKRRNKRKMKNLIKALMKEKEEGRAVGIDGVTYNLAEIEKKLYSQEVPQSYADFLVDSYLSVYTPKKEELSEDVRAGRVVYQRFGKLFGADKNGRTVYVNTFSKTLSPAVRIGYMLLPESLIKPYEERLGFYSCPVPVLEQYVLARILNDGSFERHVNKLRRILRAALS